VLRGPEVVDLTPAAIGPYWSVVNLDQHLGAERQPVPAAAAAVPIVARSAVTAAYGIVASIASKSAGRHRASIDEFTETARHQVVGGAWQGSSCSTRPSRRC
jgi:acetaldehyde dehydrogenase (acetylating)